MESKNKAPVRVHGPQHSLSPPQSHPRALHLRCPLLAASALRDDADATRVACSSASAMDLLGFGSTSSRSGRSRRLPFLCADPWQPWSDRRAVREVVSQLARTVTGGTESPESSSSTEGPPKPWWSSHPGRQGSKSRRLGATNRWARSSPPVTLLPQGCCSRGLLFPAGLLLLPAGHAPPRRAAAPAGLLLPVGLQLEPTAPGPRSVRFPVRCSSPLLCSLLHKDVNRQLHMFALLSPQ